ncbi:MAG: secondary thiamine-phosphate synthase enzyme [Acidobacteria bacterium]|jgi:secondary thiamine-phosphate synthase enzyme|nr:secondary thiamine-phosphate synthase enzyme [Acidobacteriota bacterium]|tara:strand:+ start:10949 stop:11401 length:453 start_codon:yes stop_codon:yes gene_type:complete
MKKIIKIKTDKLFTILTSEVAAYAKEWGKSGLVNIYTTHTTTSLRVLENEVLHHADIRFWLDRYLPKIKPENRRYLHDLISLRNDVPQGERINAYAHMRTLFFNTSEIVPIENGELMLGKWQDIHFIELDPGDEVYPLQERTIVCTFIEE